MDFLIRISSCRRIRTCYSSKRTIIEAIRTKGRHVDVVEVIAQLLGICAIHFIDIGDSTFIHVRTNHQTACTGKAVAADGDAAGFIAWVKRNVIAFELSLTKSIFSFCAAICIFNASILAKSNAAPLINIGIDIRILTDSYIATIGIRFIAITGTNPGTCTDSDTIRTPCISRITDGNGTRLIRVCPNTGSQSIGSGSTIIIVVLCFSIRRVNAIEMRLRCSNIRIDCFQLSHIDSIRILRTSSDIGNLTGNSWSYVTSFILFFSPAYGNGSSRRFPSGRVQC